MMRLTSGMSSATAIAHLGTASSSSSSPSMQDNKHKMKEKLESLHYPVRKQEIKKNISIDVENR